MAKISIYNNEGAAVSELELRESVFGADPRGDLFHSAVVTEEANARQGTHKSKTRTEVSGGGRKPWRQKGTGRARQGSFRAPHFRHGGVVFGPLPRDYGKGLPKKMRRSAMRGALTMHLEHDSLRAVESLTFDTPSTKAASSLLDSLGMNAQRVLVLLPEYDKSAYLSFRNIPGVEIRFAPAVSVRDLLLAQQVLTTPHALEVMQEALDR